MLVQCMLAELAPSDSALAKQLDVAMAYSNCTCGCLSAYFVVSPGLPLSTLGSRHLFAFHPEGLYTVTLDVRHGVLYELDCSTTGDDNGFPADTRDLAGWTMSMEEMSL